MIRSNRIPQKHDLEQTFLEQSIKRFYMEKITHINNINGGYKMNGKIKRAIMNSSLPYLVAPKGKWINADRQEISFEEMEKEYKVNCLKLLLKEKSNIKDGSFLYHPNDLDDKEVDEVINEAEYLCQYKIEDLKENLEENK